VHGFHGGMKIFVDKSDFIFIIAVSISVEKDRFMFAVIKTGGKQYRVAPGQIIRIEKIEADKGASVSFNEVLLIGKGSGIEIGRPALSSATVTGEVLGQIRGPKLIVFKKKRRKGYRKKTGHRQSLTVIRIKEIAS